MRGFSLVELSIVLVILGLLTGGILAGQSLIHASELRAVSTEYQRYAAAVNTFRDKYFAVPGDFNSATRFWGRLQNTADCVTNSAAAVAAPGACDGNGDGVLLQAAAVASTSSEHLQVWKHLALAGLIEGTYLGTYDASAAVTVGTVVPQSKLGNSKWFASSAFNWAGDANSYALDYGNYFANTSSAGAANLNPEDAWNIDTKLDDGKPATGKIIARFWNNACAAADDGTHANNDLVASYRLSNTAINCYLYFIKQL